MTRVAPSFAAFDAIARILEPLTPEDRGRVIGALAVFYLELPAADAEHRLMAWMERRLAESKGDPCGDGR